MKIDKRRIKSFIRAGVSKGLTDQEMAAQLNVGVSTINRWRNQFGIQPADKFRRHFTEKYGADAIGRFQTLVEKNATLQEIGDSFGFSRENARLICIKLYGRREYKR